jgi:hypothetical protein
MATLEELMNELQVLGGVRGQPRASQRPVPSPRFRALIEGDGGLAARENLKGKVEVLAKRMEGVTDFLSDGNLQAAQIALEKIIKDAQETLEEMGSSKKKEAAEKAEKQQKKAKAQQQEKPGGAPDRAAGKEQESPKGTPAQAPPAQGAKEDLVYAGGMLLEHADDPFGLGEEFKEFVRKRSGLGDSE